MAEISKKTQKNAKKICIYRKKNVPLCDFFKQCVFVCLNRLIIGELLMRLPTECRLCRQLFVLTKRAIIASIEKYSVLDMLYYMYNYYLNY